MVALDEHLVLYLLVVLLNDFRRDPGSRGKCNSGQVTGDEPQVYCEWIELRSLSGEEEPDRIFFLPAVPPRQHAAAAAQFIQHRPRPYVSYFADSVTGPIA